MAKRKRLTPVQSGFLYPGTGQDTLRPLSQAGPSRPPIAAQAGEAAALSALEALRGEWQAARDGGRLVVSIPLEGVQTDHLMRDRVGLDAEALSALKESLRARGQQQPVEVVALAEGRFGLISGWRRMTALRELSDETGDARFASVLALIRQPEELAYSYVSMVEENEIRSDLSHYERARIVRRAQEEGVFPSEKAALQSLFASASYARRSKIKSFLPVVDALDGVLRFPSRMTERTGLALSKALETEGLAEALREALETRRPETPEAESACLLGVVARDSKAAPERA